jgi:thiamine-phosphate pyrophosphorylase
MKLPLLYPILDVDCLATGCVPDALLRALCTHARALAEGGCTLMQYRAKNLNVREALVHARELRRLLPQARLVMNDRADLCLAAGFDGVHVGQEDLSPEAVRGILGPGRIIGFSTHNPAQLAEALTRPIDYVAIGPVFPTGSKAKADPVIGIEGVAAARRLLDDAGSKLPLVAIGGITRVNAESVLRAGADSLAVIGDLSGTPRESARAFFRLMM